MMKYINGKFKLKNSPAQIRKYFRAPLKTPNVNSFMRISLDKANLRRPGHSQVKKMQRSIKESS